MEAEDVVDAVNEIALDVADEEYEEAEEGERYLNVAEDINYDLKNEYLNETTVRSVTAPSSNSLFIPDDYHELIDQIESEHPVHFTLPK